MALGTSVAVNMRFLSNALQSSAEYIISLQKFEEEHVHPITSPSEAEEAEVNVIKRYITFPTN